MDAPLAPGKFLFALAVTLAILMSIAPYEASARGGTFRLESAWSPVSRA